MNPQNENLKVLKRVQMLINMTWKPINNFPRYERNILGNKMKDCLLQAATHLSVGNSVSSKKMKKDEFQKADGHIETFNILLQLADKNRYISLGFSHNVDRELTVIKSQIVNLIKSSV